MSVLSFLRNHHEPKENLANATFSCNYKPKTIQNEYSFVCLNTEVAHFEIGIRNCYVVRPSGNSVFFILISILHV